MKKERLDDGIVSFLGQIRWAQFEKWPMKKKTEIGEGAACVWVNLPDFVVSLFFVRRIIAPF